MSKKTKTYSSVTYGKNCFGRYEYNLKGPNGANWSSSGYDSLEDAIRDARERMAQTEWMKRDE